MAIETDRAKIARRLGREGWTARHGSKHDVYTNVTKPETSIVVPRHRTMSHAGSPKMPAGLEEHRA